MKHSTYKNTGKYRKTKGQGQKISKRKVWFARILIFVFVISTILSIGIAASAAQAYHEIYIEDNEDLLTDQEESMLMEYMSPIGSYGGVAFVTASSRNAESTARSKYREYFGTSSGIVFLIDMGVRQLYIFSDGAIYRVIGKSYANTITDNIYKMATAGKYYDCAKEAFIEIEKVLSGGRILQPMKYINNGFIALALASILTYFWATFGRRELDINTSSDSLRRKKYTNSHSKVTFDDLYRVHIRTIDHTPSKSSSSSSGGGGGGGGGSSGGGGGHGF